MRDELELARRIHRGEPRAFEEFVDSHGARVHAIVRRYLDNVTDAEDLTQEIFVHLYTNIGTFRGASALSTWVYRVTVNQCLKRLQRAKPRSLAYEEQAELPSHDARSDPERAAVRGELAERVRDAVGRLSPVHQDVVRLHEIHGLTYQECAEVLDVPVGTVKSRLFNAFRRLRETLEEYVAPEATARAGGAGEEPA